MTTPFRVLAPLAGTIESVSASVGDNVVAGDVLMILESMKVHVQVKAESSGIIKDIFISQGDTVNRDTPLMAMAAEVGVQQGQQAPSASEINANHYAHSSLAKFQTRQAKTLDKHRDQARLKRHAKGYRTARENLAELCDPKSFIEYGQLAVAAQRQRSNFETLQGSTAADGIITGVGKVNEEVFTPAMSKTALIINDYSVLAGTQGFFHHQKLDRILQVAGEQKLPVIMFSEGGGGRPGDTDVLTVNSGLQCTSFVTWAALQGIVPRIAVANGYNFAGNAALFGAADITIATRKSWIGMAGPAMIAGGGLGDFKPTDIGPIDVQANNGVVDIVAEDEAAAAQIAKQVLGFFQGAITDWQAAEQTELQSTLPENRRMTYQIRDILERVADANTFVELKATFGGSVIVGFMRLEGVAVGLLASDCNILGGAIDIDAGEKAADFIELCNSFNIPIVSFCDTPGFMVGPEHEQRGAVRRLAKMFTSGAKFKPPFYAVVVRKCYGLGAQAMLGGSTQNPTYTMAWPTGEFGPMGLEGSVQLGFKKELESIDDPDERQAMFDKLLAEQYQRGQAMEVASVVEIDAVIDPADTRKTLVDLVKHRPN